MELWEREEGLGEEGLGLAEEHRGRGKEELIFLPLEVMAPQVVGVEEGEEEEESKKRIFLMNVSRMRIVSHQGALLLFLGEEE